MSVAARIKANPRLKALALWLLMIPRQARPRWWVRYLVNPLRHHYGRRVVVRDSVRGDLVPFNPFELGEESVIEDFSVVNNGMGGIHIGARTLVGLSNVLIGPLRIGNDVILAQHVVLSGLNHGYERLDQPVRDQNCTTAEIVVEDDAWLGANVVVTAGVRIGRHAVVAAGSVVTKDVPPYTVVAGNPARPLRRYVPATGHWERIVA